MVALELRARDSWGPGFGRSAAARSFPRRGPSGPGRAGGDCVDGSLRTQAFVAGEAEGTWEPAQEVPGTAALNRGGFAEITSVSCARAGDCSAGGFYADGSFHLRLQAFVAGEAK